MSNDNLETNDRNYCDSNGIKVELQMGAGQFPVRFNLGEVEVIDWITSKVQKIDPSKVRWTIRLNLGKREDAKLIVYEDGRPFRSPSELRRQSTHSVRTVGAMAIGAVLWQFTLMAVAMFNTTMNVFGTAL
jgi:hypothetical protein